MQSYNLQLTPAKQSVVFNEFSSGIWYESGTSALETRIVVTPESGNKIELKPGQRVKLTNTVRQWTVESLNPAATISGKLLIGSGEFEDNSSLVTLDASFANNVTVMNASIPVTISGGDVEIKNDIGNPIQTSITNTPAVTISGTATVQENLIAASGIGSHTNKTGSFVTTFVTAAANVNGIIVHAASGSFVTPNQAASVSLIAKNGGSPANIDDGTTLIAGAAGVSSAGQFALPTKIRLPAGYSLSYVNSGAGSPFALMNAGVAYTLL